MTVDVRVLERTSLLEALPDLAALRIEVFREFPYLYDGDAAAEQEYLAEFAEAEGAIMVVAVSAGRIVGASTGLPLSSAHPAFRVPFVEAGEPLEKWFYFSESVLKRDFRGQGIGCLFFDEREKHARQQGFERYAFCSVIRPDGHPLQPESHRSLEPFWTRKGFSRREKWVAELAWKQVDSGRSEVRNRLVFWTKEPGNPQM